MTPTIVLDGNQPVLVLGAPGATRIITAVLQVILNRLDFGMTHDRSRPGSPFRLPGRNDFLPVADPRIRLRRSPRKAPHSADTRQRTGGWRWCTPLRSQPETGRLYGAADTGADGMALLVDKDLMKLAIAQLNPTVGDVAGNSELVCSCSAAGARGRGRPARRLGAAHQRLSAERSAAARGIRGGLRPGRDETRSGRPIRSWASWSATRRGSNLPEGTIGNAASLLYGGQVQKTIYKCLLPNYDVFDERRYFLPAESAAPVDFRRACGLGVHICEDAWFGEPGTSYHLQPENRRDPVAELAAAGADLLINLSASPFEIDKPHRRTQIIARHVARHKLPFVFVNQVGGNDDLVFDGNSLVFDGTGENVVQLAPFESDFARVRNQSSSTSHRSPSRRTRRRLRFRVPARPTCSTHSSWASKDYMRKSGFRDCVLGLSGGIDSALACYIAAAAVGPDHVHGLALPSRYSSDHSVSDAQTARRDSGHRFRSRPHQCHSCRVRSDPCCGGRSPSQPAGLADQNLQARIRGALVMIRSNRHGWLALATGNKSELAVGYCTLYGDMAGGFAVLADVFKRDVYAVARYINEVREEREVIPAGSLTKAPSAELAPNQFDQDTLPPYPVLDAILEGLIEREVSIETLSRQFPPGNSPLGGRRLDRNEFKRRQMPPGIKLSQRAFGSGRRMPMAAKFNWE